MHTDCSDVPSERDWWLANESVILTFSLILMGAAIVTLTTLGLLGVI